ncbi:hypothetical protein RvY_10554 [Ramazzottius varieornatus]|uniref:SGNH domain-containing protein n=1 Tax=Ramazzottius varieornatus TaxID=947166 RepID=A0A1D1VHM1_RAMVA|nr:hypothetical protein RvY_10554 [Ramazzottius varieornatus]
MVNAQRSSKSLLIFAVVILYAVSLRLYIRSSLFDGSSGCVHQLCLDHLAHLSRTEDCSWSVLRNKIGLLRNKMLAFVGDSRMRLMYSYVADLLMHVENADRLYTEPLDARDARNDVSFWIPDLNITLYYFRLHQPDEHHRLKMFIKSPEKQKAFDYAIFETGSWSLFNGGLTVLPDFRKNLTEAAMKLSLLPRETLFIWMQTCVFHFCTILCAIPSGVYDLCFLPTVPFHPYVKSQRNRWVIERGPVYRDIEQFGRVMREVADEHGVTLWQSAHDLALQHPELYADRVHPNRQLYQKFICQFFDALDWQNCPAVGTGHNSRSVCVH